MRITQPITLENSDGSLAVVFAEATTPEERSRCYKLASTAFGKALSEAGYVDREHFLGKLPLVRGNGWRFWTLVTADGPERVVAMCKTMHRDLLVRDARGTRQEQGYCICSVVTDANHRGRGLASILLKNVAEWLDGPGDATASMLYSDVGKFYVSRGWDTLDAFHSTLTRPPSPPPEQAQLVETRHFTKDELPSLCERDVESLKGELSTDGRGELMTVLPTGDLVGWLQGRAEFMGNALVGKASDVKGTICESADAWLYWYHDYDSRKLYVQRIKKPRLGYSDATRTRALAQLLLDALDEAQKWQFTGVIVWNPDSEVQSALTLLSQEFGVDVTSEEREQKSVPCVRWRGGEKRSTVILPNEFYAWS
ncbi:hypothetical protein GGS23DRAFT_144296 [Durotheca rogersii]|uniref:uncharacterized protein n=1 Tax=Durotheca rogersii TaxID=419775 RepID=UPI00221F1199|nr:uncharacterized protein GGS23DRAFT_144296 [Durotheca rogersii]KAI5861667.1 hypothetical protein GGS23DRAFT_144296 [Durotheca rogersii]